MRHEGKSSKGNYLVENRKCWTGILERAGNWASRVSVYIETDGMEREKEEN